MFLEADESMEKIELKKDLEGLISQHLCNIPHEQKFYLPQTRRVLENSIAKLEDFSAYKAAIGFDAINQYANNLFTKPWRKEYKVIKMYSGFYQHEISANLIEADMLFEEMGYRSMTNQTLVLDGPICPDRVANVSRDAITAKVECRIMKEIYRQLTEMSLPVNWSDIYSFRQCNNMNVVQSVKLLATLIQEKHQKTQQARRKESYSSTQAPAASSCNSCNTYQFHPHVQQQQPQQQPLAHMAALVQQTPPMPFFGPQPLYNTVSCSMHSQAPGPAYGYHHHNNFHNSYLPGSPLPPHIHPTGHSSAIPPQTPILGTIPHSKSLDHYQDPAAAMYNLTACMQRHSIDQAFDYAAASSASHYGGPMGMGPPTGTYDAIDNYNIPITNHPYNVSGNRFPLPYNLSTNLGPGMNGIPVKQNGNEPFFQTSINGYQQMSPYYHHRSSSNGHIYAQQTQPQRQAADVYMNHNFDHSGTQTPTSILSKKKTSYDDYDVPSIRHGADAKIPGDLIYIDSLEEAKKERKKSDRVSKNTDLLVDYETEMLPEALAERNQHQHRHPYLTHQTSRNSRQSDFDSYEDEQLQTGVNQRTTNVTKLITSKNQDGIGSYEQWDYVFQNLEKQGYIKDLGERGDFLVDVDGEEHPEAASASRNGTIKRSSNDKLKAMKAKSADKVDGIRMPSSKQTQSTKHDRDNERNEAVARCAQRPNSVQKVVKSSSNNHPDNSLQKANHVSNPTRSTGTISRRNSTTRKMSSSSKENGISVNPMSSSSAYGGGILVNHNNSPHSVTPASGKKKTSFDTAAATIINPTDSRNPSNNGYGNRSEWNCEFCTFLNPESKRICEMCAKSRDFNLSSGTTTTTTNSGTATCV